VEYNIYCDETCHIQNEDSDYMIIGSIYCPKAKVQEISQYIKKLKNKYKIGDKSEIKWTKVSNNKIEFYTDLINYFFIEDDLSFRAIVCDKTELDHKKYNQTHDEWYHKMYYDMLKYIFSPNNTYNIYGDIKDNNSYKNFQKTLNFLRLNIVDSTGKTIKKMQPINSNESTILQMTDLIIGALAYFYRGLETSEAKLKVVELIQKQLPYSLGSSTPFGKQKFNVFIWEPNYDGRR
jgi:hypothetical protein